MFISMGIYENAIHSTKQPQKLLYCFIKNNIDFCVHSNRLKICHERENRKKNENIFWI